MLNFLFHLHFLIAGLAYILLTTCLVAQLTGRVSAGWLAAILSA